MGFSNYIHFTFNYRVTAGSELELQCAATGDPAPLITWFKDGRQVDTFLYRSSCRNLSAISPKKLGKNLAEFYYPVS